MLTEIQRDFGPSQDFNEMVGNKLLYPIRLYFGRRVVLEKDSPPIEITTFKTKKVAVAAMLGLLIYATMPTPPATNAIAWIEFLSSNCYQTAESLIKFNVMLAPLNLYFAAKLAKKDAVPDRKVFKLSSKKKAFAAFLGLFFSQFMLPIPLPTLLPAMTALGYYRTRGSESYKEAKNLLEDIEEKYHFDLPERRWPPLGSFDTMRITEKNGGYAKGKAIFIVDSDIIKRHSMFFLPSPYPVPVSSEIDASESAPVNKKLQDTVNKMIQHDEEARKKALAISESGKHILFQQANRSCVPTAIAMLVLDHKGTPCYSDLQSTDLANKRQAENFVKKAGFVPLTTPLNTIERPLLAEKLASMIKQNGPGVLSIKHSSLGAHVVVLDEISTYHQTATLRDPYHGWMVTIKLATLLSWINHYDYFMQLQNPPKPI